MARTKPEEEASTCPPVDVWFALNLKTMRAHRKLSMRELGELTSMDKRCIWRLEHRRHAATLPTANAIANALGLDLCQMLVSPAKFKQVIE